MQILLWVVIGGLAGWIAGKLIRGDSFGLLGNLALGVAGGAIGGPLLGLVGLSNNGGFIGSLVTAIIGAVIMLWCVAFFREKFA
ncbi:GlsB/YeaQ/YmgE family stress response membrane protein [Carnimonas nigrificans]|uniref:GlsB/YeaQ/YmgE family stress response membrane protein n=1 Tax=Carnimonas nigrificans TaxID=64323 RepID=UPI000471190F|nr:GlsB/YeaQ/YmgE family stress response membrane protein [Carnimonas nigrificans]